MASFDGFPAGTVPLSRERVAALVGGRVFKEWVLVPKAHRARLLELLREAGAFAS